MEILAQIIFLYPLFVLHTKKFAWIHIYVSNGNDVRHWFHVLWLYCRKKTIELWAKVMVSDMVEQVRAKTTHLTLAYSKCLNKLGQTRKYVCRSAGDPSIWLSTRNVLVLNTLPRKNDIIKYKIFMSTRTQCKMCWKNG